MWNFNVKKKKRSLKIQETKRKKHSSVAVLSTRESRLFDWGTWKWAAKQKYCSFAYDLLWTRRSLSHPRSRHIICNVRQPFLPYLCWPILACHFCVFLGNLWLMPPSCRFWNRQIDRYIWPYLHHREIGSIQRRWRRLLSFAHEQWIHKIWTKPNV